MSKFVGNGPSSYKKIIYRTAVSQRWRNTGVRHCTFGWLMIDAKRVLREAATEVILKGP